jgi:hypothetical protein
VGAFLTLSLRFDKTVFHRAETLFIGKTKDSEEQMGTQAFTLVSIAHVNLSLEPFPKHFGGEHQERKTLMEL